MPFWANVGGVNSVSQKSPDIQYSHWCCKGQWRETFRALSVRNNGFSKDMASLSPGRSKTNCAAKDGFEFMILLAYPSWWWEFLGCAIRQVLCICIYRFFCLHVHRCTICVPGDHRGQKKESDAQELELPMAWATMWLWESIYGVLGPESRALCIQGKLTVTRKPFPFGGGFQVETLGAWRNCGLSWASVQNPGSLALRLRLPATLRAEDSGWPSIFFSLSGRRVGLREWERLCIPGTEYLLQPPDKLQAVCPSCYRRQEVAPAQWRDHCYPEVHQPHWGLKTGTFIRQKKS